MRTFAGLVCFACTAVAAGYSFPVQAEQNAPKKKLRVQTVASEPVVIRAQGHPSYMDFVARSSKRADLRTNVQRKGLNAAFTEWLRTEHAHVYREHLAALARQNKTQDAITQR